MAHRRPIRLKLQASSAPGSREEEEKVDEDEVDEEETEPWMVQWWE